MDPEPRLLCQDGSINPRPTHLSKYQMEDIIAWFGPIPNPDDAPDPWLCGDENKRVWREE
jgi:hypothetical protein